ncbi:hypothetical protein MKZ38_005373 [Zalerion maritima]|uniref:Zn(2)-C6 fungal-type domain-containing protein n=1 Tax=Zalerion maritima TaxID=339359 RepID=A0AAD5RY24_9PEZI|nr:hypothetical protein MKZ38_005373 [Zalerion maritima]
MSDLYHQFLSSMTGVGAPPAQGQNPQEMLPHHPQPPQQPMGIPMTGSPVPNQYQSLGYFTGFPDPIMFNTQKAQRSRRKPAGGLDHIKHRRTRSGCYTCRSRRVKCDETHPVCDRCRKGKRDCVYPEPAGAKASSSSGAKESGSQTSPISSHGDEDDDEDDGDRESKLDTIPDEDEPVTPTIPMPGLRRMSTASSLSLQRTDTPSLEGTKSASPSVFSDPSFSGPATQPDLSQLPHDLRFYLTYFGESISHYHYCAIVDMDDFFRGILPDIAFQNEPLLYAVVGFAAYHHALQDPRGRISEFLQYYNRSVTLLLTSLKREEQPSIATLLTILQLATIEEYLGDWVNLTGHQRAAFEVLCQLFTPQTITQSPIGRAIHSWYGRFDVFVSLMGGFEPSLSRGWFSAHLDLCNAQIAADPKVVGWRMEECSSQIRLTSMEMAVLFAKRGRKEIPKEVFLTEHARISSQLAGWRSQWDPRMTNPDFVVTDFTPKRLLTEDDISNPFVPGSLYTFPLFATTLLTCQWHSLILLHESQATINAQSRDPPAELTDHAMAICRIFEAVELWPSSPAGSLFAIQSSLAIAAIFVPRDPRHHLWMRRKFAFLELMGQVFLPLMAELFRDPSCNRWWLPNEEGFSPLLREIRAFADERNAAAIAAQPERLGEIKRVFANLQLGVTPGTEDELL